MTNDQHTATAIIQPTGVVIHPVEARVVFDETWSPYVQVELVCQLPDPADRAQIDLRTDDELRLDLRVRRDFGRSWSLADLTTAGGVSGLGWTGLMGGQLGVLTNLFYLPWNGAQVRASQRLDLDLYITEREFDDEAKTVRIVAQSDEAKLETDALVSTTPLDPGTTSLAAIVQTVLDRYGAVLVEADDATVDETDATIWQPGDPATRYLEPLLEAASLRLWCDERRQWRLGPRQPTVPGAVVLTDSRLTNNRDRMTFNPAEWFDAVVVEYRWTDEFDLNRVERDVAGPTPAKSVRRELRENTIYPGPGAADGILNRARSRGRVLEVTAVNDYTVRPGMATTITPPSTPIQTGYTSRVEWVLPDAEMYVSTRGLVDTPETSWLFVEAGVGWDDIAEGVAWEEYAA